MVASINASTSAGVVVTSDTSGSLALQTNSGVTALTIDTSQNVGIGTSSPVQKEHLDGGAGDTYLQFSNSTTGATSSDGSRIGIASADNTLRIQNLESASIRFDTAATERARIDSSGNLLVGTTNTTPVQSNVTGFSYRPSSQLEINGVNTQAAFFGRSNDGQVIRFFNAGASAGNISNTGTVTTYNGTSDYRLKDNIQPMTGGLQKVLALKPVTYIWKADGRAGQGFIAHELQEVIPDAVQGEKDALDENGNPEYQGIDPRMIVATLTAALQEQQALITALTARITALENPPAFTTT